MTREWILAVAATAAMASVAGAMNLPFAKNRCLLHEEGCPTAKESLPEKIEHLKREIDKGKAVYTDAELKRLQEKLEEAELLRDFLLYHPGS